MSLPSSSPSGAVRVVICDYSALLQSVTGLLRMTGYAVFQAYDGLAAEELCASLGTISLLVLNTEGSGVDTPGLVKKIRATTPGLPVLHIGKSAIPGMPEDVTNLPESFTAAELLGAVTSLIRE